VDRTSPQAVFAAYKKATNDRDWKALFSLGTTSRQNFELMQIAVGLRIQQIDPAQPDEIRAYRLILAKHGIDWQEVKKLAAEAEASGENAFSSDTFLVPMQRIIDRVTNKADLFSAANDFLSKCSDPVAVTVHGMENLVQNESTATCDSIESHFCTATVNDGRRTSKVRQKVEGTSALGFRRIHGRWFLD
jgi:hypothetical protein